MSNYFEILNGINCNDKVEKKGKLTYLSWAYAWAEAKKRFPDSTYTIYENKDGLFYHTDGRTCWVKTGVTVNGIEHIEYLPVMNNVNDSIPLEKVTSFDVNKSIQRSLTKALARHGVGLYIYAGEDIPEEAAPVCENCGSEITAYQDDKGKAVSLEKHLNGTMGRFGKKLCLECAIKYGSMCEKCGKQITDSFVNGEFVKAADILAASRKATGHIYCPECAASLHYEN